MYRPGERSSDGMKLKLERQQEFVVGGYLLGAPNSVDALLVGYYEGKELRFAGKVRGGFIPNLRRSLLHMLKPLGISRCPFSNLPDADPSRRSGRVTAEQMKVRGTCKCRVKRPASAFELLPLRGRPPYLKDVKIEENPLPHGPWEANGELTSVPEANTCRGNTTTVALDQTADQGESDTETRVRTAR